MAKSTFRDFVTSRTVIASAPVDEEVFLGIIKNVNEEFSLKLVSSKEAFELFQDRIRVVAGRFWDEFEAVDRKTVLDRLSKLAAVSRTRRLGCPLFEMGYTKPPTPRS